MLPGISIAEKEKLKERKKRGVLVIKERKPLREQLTAKSNGLTSTQEVLYQKEFKRADRDFEKLNEKKK